jgi:hypothetical protein
MYDIGGRRISIRTNPFKLTHYRRCPSLDVAAHAMVFSAPS